MTARTPTVAAAAPDRAPLGHGVAPTRFWTLTLGSIGVVYGDIGTSPLYAFREALAAASGPTGAVSAEAVLGVLSLILWALVLIVTVKYVIVLLRADNRGEGGTLSLMALAQRAIGRTSLFLLALGTMGAALFYGDAVITPAISVLSAVEGLKEVAPGFGPYVVPLTIAILIGLFLVQSHGTARVAAFFGPVTAIWFMAMAAFGIVPILRNPSVLAAVNPVHAVAFLATHGVVGLVTLGAVFLAVTGAEALYADLGHFGRRPIQTAWIGLVLPALAANYLGQGALVLSDPKALESPFFRLMPDWALLPMVLLATAATVIASQAVITGAYSLSQQAIQLGLMPRMEIRHTSESQAGQIYISRVNTLLLFGVLVLVLVFRSSSALASAYGIAVTGTMVITAMMAFMVVWRFWKWSPLAAGLLMAPFFVIDAIFLAANLLKVIEGGWVPLMLAGALMIVMGTWRKGTRLLAEKTRRTEVPLAMLVDNLEKRQPQRVAGTALFLTSDPDSAPTALLHSLKHYKVLHEKNAILTVATADVPRVADEERVRIELLSDTFARITMTFGFMETPNVPKALAICRRSGFKYDIMSTSFFLSRRNVKPAAKPGMPLWQDHLFITLAKTADDASDYFCIPTNRVVEIGTQVLL